MLVTLQIGRGLAAIAVAAFHLSDAFVQKSVGTGGFQTLMDFAGRGYLGVDFFFVLSGFIILQAHHRDIGDPRQIQRYFSRRFVRIYPIYWIYLTACIASMAFIGSSHLQLRSLSEWLTPYSLVGFASIELPLRQAWTLFHEIAFYALFGILIYSYRIGVTVLGIWFIATVALFEYTPTNEVSIATVFLSAYNINFLIGMLAFLLLKKYSGFAACLVAVFGVILFVGAFRYHLTGHAIEATRLLFGISFGLMISGAAALENMKFLSLPSHLGFVGDASYSIYLLHEHIENYSIRAFSKIGLQLDDAPWTIYCSVLLVTIVVGCFAHVILERPLLSVLRRYIEMPRRDAAPRKIM